MLKAEYKRDMYNNYMVFSEEEGLEEVYGLKMLMRNKIPGLLKLEVREVDSQRQYYYDITSQQPMELVFQKGQLSREQIVKIMEGIFVGIEAGRNFLLNAKDFLLDPKYIYFHLSSFRVELCYKPGYNHPLEEQLCSVIEYIMDRVDYKKEDAVLLSYGLYKVCRSDSCTIHELKRVLDGKHVPYEPIPARMVEEVIAEVEEETPDTRAYLEEDVTEEEEVRKYSKKTWVSCGIMVIGALGIIFICGKMGFLFNPVSGETEVVKVAALLGVIGAVEFFGLSYILDESKKETVMKKRDVYVKSYLDETEDGRNSQNAQVLYEGGEEQTVLLGGSLEQAKEERYVLSPANQDTYQEIKLIEFPFFIGKLKTNVDFSISHATISRFHAKLEQEGESIFLTDLHSTNGTFLNGKRIPANERKKISLKDQISFANVMYILEKV